MTFRCILSLAFANEWFSWLRLRRWPLRVKNTNFDFFLWSVVIAMYLSISLGREIVVKVSSGDVMNSFGEIEDILIEPVISVGNITGVLSVAPT